MVKKFAFIQPLICDGNLTPPLGTLIMSAIIEKEGWDVHFFDERFNINAVNSLIDFQPNMVGISAVTASILRGRDLADQIKRALPETIIVLGGPHPTAMPEEVSVWNSIDFVVVGEGEYTIKDLCDWYLSGREPSALQKIPNLCYTFNGKFIQNKNRAFLSSSELDILPRPAYHLLNIEEVFKEMTHGLFQKGKRILPVMFSRGCPSQCTFCCRVMGFQIRYRNTEMIMNEIESLVKDYNLDEVWFEDDNFTANPKRAHEILDYLIELNLGVYIKFANGIRADGVDNKMLEKMQNAGCYNLSFAIESGSSRVLKMMQKNLSLTKAKENIDMAKSMGFLVGSNCIIGYPGETVDEVKESLDFFMDLNLDSMAITNLIPFPGTELRRICEENGYLTAEAENWNNYIFDINNPKILIETECLDGKAIKSLIKMAYYRMYLNPKRVYKIMRHMKHKNIIKGAYIILSKFIRGLIRE
jgi:radical SAM superfamily enzyme YgiQ (UPF0313 family)